MTQHPLLSVWTQPRATLRAIIAENPNRFVLGLTMLAGINQTLDRGANNRSPLPSLPVMIAAVLIIGPLSGLFSLWVGSWLIRWTGRWMGGGASGKHLRAAMAWAAVPAVTALLLWVLRFAIFGADAFALKSIYRPGPTAFPGLVFVMGLADMVLAVWGLVLLCNTVAEVQGFRSAWQGVANLILAGLVVAVPIILLIIAMFVLYNGR